MNENKTTKETRGRKALYDEPMQRASIQLPVTVYNSIANLSRQTGVPMAFYLRKYLLAGYRRLALGVTDGGEEMA